MGSTKQLRKEARSLNTVDMFGHTSMLDRMTETCRKIAYETGYSDAKKGTVSIDEDKTEEKEGIYVGNPFSAKLMSKKYPDEYMNGFLVGVGERGGEK